MSVPPYSVAIFTKENNFCDIPFASLDNASLQNGVSETGFNVPPTTRSYETGPRFRVSPERPEKLGMDLEIPGLVV